MLNNNYTLLLLIFIFSFNSFSQRKKNKQKISTEKITYNNLSWRNIGPFRGGRSVASCGLIQKENIFCVANDSLWYKLDDLKNLIPFKLYNDEHFLRNYQYTEAPDGDYVWILFFTENRLKNGLSPLDMVREKIIAIVVNQRKQELIQKLSNTVYNKALENEEIKIYFDE